MEAWKRLPENTKCTSSLCTGTIVYYQIKKCSVMCQFHVIPFVLHSYFALPHIYGNYIDDHNVTHTLSDCTATVRGIVCGMMTRQMEPCLLSHSSNLCDLTIYPVNNFSMIYEVSAQHICISSNNFADLIFVGIVYVPFSGCIFNVSFLHWQGDDFLLFP